MSQNQIENKLINFSFIKGCHVYPYNQSQGKNMIIRDLPPPPGDLVMTSMRLVRTCYFPRYE